ncbi:14228_t:CDS:2, partial [Ambispora leptoticha]
MGKTVWNQWANLIALTAGVFEIIGGIFGMFYRIAMFGHITTIFDRFVDPLNILAILA